MNKTIVLVLISSLMAGCGGAATTSDFFAKNETATAGVIYGDNSISEVKKTEPNNSASVALIKKEDYLALKNKEEGYRVSDFISEDLSWKDQPISAFCSGVLISENQFLTAGHCFAETKCEEFVAAFNYDLSGKEIQGIECKKIEIIKNSLDEEGLDYALVTLAEKVAIKPVIFSEKMLSEKSAVYSLGYPLGAYKKKSEGQIVEIAKGLYRSDLDLFTGNSGSPVFSAETHELVGIVSSGETDFEENSEGSGPARIKHCQIESCRGEFITPIQKILADIAKTN